MLITLSQFIPPPPFWPWWTQVSFSFCSSWVFSPLLCKYKSFFSVFLNEGSFFFPSFSIDSSFTLVHRKSLEWIVVGLIAFSLLIHKFSSALPFFNGPGYTCHLLQNFLSHKARSHSTNLRWHPWIVPRGISSLYLHSATALQAPVNLMTVYCICCCSVMSHSLQPQGLQHTKLSVLLYLSEFAQIHVHWLSDAIQPSHPLPPHFSSCLHSFPASGVFPVNQLFASDGQSIGDSASTSILLINIQAWFPLGLLVSPPCKSKGLLRVFSNTTIWNQQFYHVQP